MPPLANFADAGISRRRFLELMGASLALAGASACAPPREQIVPYVRPPADVVPGKPLFYASAHVLGGFAQGVLVQSQMGRPTKIEGNPQHPASLGGTDAFAQASVLTLYDPNRAQTVTHQRQISTLAEFSRTLNTALAQFRTNAGEGLRFLSGATTSPTLGAQMQQILSAFPNARWHRWEAVSRDNVLDGAALAFGARLDTRLRFDAADVIVALDADPFAWSAGRVRYMHDFALRRRPETGPLSRVYAIESAPSLLGSAADHRLPLRATAIEQFAFALAGALGVSTGATAANPPPGVPAGWLAALTADLRRAGTRALIVAGEAQPATVHALAHAMNAALGSVGTTVDYSDPVEVDPVQHAASLSELVTDMAAGRVGALIVLGGNPVYTAPADVPFGANLGNVGLNVYLGQFADETAAACQWHIPESHSLEAWSDARAFDGTVSILQPLIAPLYPETRSAHELLAAFGDQPTASSHDIVRSYWQNQHAGADFEAFWRQSLHDGIVADTAQPPRTVSVRADWARDVAQSPSPSEPTALELVFRPDMATYDGRFASNGWLMELPRPLSKLTWDNVAQISPRTAQRLGLANGDVVELRSAGQSVEAPIWIQPGQADDSVCVTLGYGRGRGAGVGNGVGFDAYRLRQSAAPWLTSDVTLVRTGRTHSLASTQGHYTMEGRDLVRTLSLDALQSNTSTAQPPAASLFPPHPTPDNAWGMVIDLNACVGCNACIVACQAENNIPVVGKEEVARGREMQWLRVDTYYDGATDNPRMLQQLVPCMQCENAPCEVVCPVGATVHSDEGLNDMVYNRCVGTRYCSNNCPYKVRHFNFFQYSDFDTPVLKLLRNPEVTVRSRGVMEKCTYCIQRITAARIDAEKENRPIRDGEVMTACQAACPSGAIVFGNLNDAQSQVARQKALARNYTLLEELNTRPRTTYLASVPNPNPSVGAS